MIKTWRYLPIKIIEMSGDESREISGSKKTKISTSEDAEISTFENAEITTHACIIYKVMHGIL